jgi:hypothetical protein
MTIAFSNILAAWFVSPGFAVAGAALASIPIIIHILNRRRFKVVKWAAMEYLLQAMRKNRRRLKFEQWLLLAVRCLLIFLMGMALARPLGCENNTIAALGGQRTALHVFVIDNSYSMAYEPGGRPDAKTHLDQAKLMARQLIDRLSPGNEEVMIITASSPIDKDKTVDPHAVTPKPTYDLQAARAAVDRIEQSATATDLDGALQLALRTAKEESKLPSKHLYVFTDGTRSAFEGEEGKAVDALKQTGPQLAQAFGRPNFFVLGKPGQSNQAVLKLNPAGNLVTTKFSADFVTDVKGYGAGSDPVLQWKMNDVPVGVAKPVKLDLKTPPQSLSGLTITEGGPRVFSVSLAGDDRLKIDNTRWRVVDVASEMKVLLVEGERGIGALAGSASYLDLALAPPKDLDPDHLGASGGKTDSYVLPDPPIGELELSNKILDKYRAVFLTDVGQVNPNQADQLKKYVEQGGTLIIFVGPTVNSDNYNQQLVPRGLLPGRLIKTVSSTDKAFHFDFNPNGNSHPFLKEFKGDENSGLTTAQVTSYWQMELPANTNAERVLDYQAQPDKPKDPAITVHSLGRGRVVFFSTTANPEWNALMPKPVFVVLIHEILAGSVGAADRWMNLTVGDSVTVPQSLGLTSAPTLYDSSKNPVPMEAVTDQSGVTSYHSAKPMTRPGVYSLNIGIRTYPVAVNVPPNEADVRVISADAIKKAMGDVDLAMEGDTLSATALKLDSGNDWSWSFMALVLLLAGLECFLAMHFGHYRRQRRPVVTPEPQLGTGN